MEGVVDGIANGTHVGLRGHVSKRVKKLEDQLAPENKTWGEREEKENKMEEEEEEKGAEGNEMKSLRHVTSPTVRASWRGAVVLRLLCLDFFLFNVYLAWVDRCRA